MTERQVVKMMADEIVSAIRKLNEENNLGYVDSKIRNTPALVNPDSLYSVLDANRIKGLGAYVGNKIENAEIDGSQIVGVVNPSSISITTAQIQDLEAEVADIAQAEISNANIDTAQINDLKTYVANISKAEIEDASIDVAQIENLNAAAAEIAKAEISNADIGFAQIKDLVSDTAIIREGVGGKLYIDRLAVTEAQVLTLFTGELIMQGTDGKLYTLYLENGEIKTEERIIKGADIGSGEVGTDNIASGAVTGGNIAEGTIEGSNIMQNTITGALITEDAITARELNVSKIFADEALIGAITAANIDVATLFASEAFIGELQTSIISGVSTEGNVPAKIELNKNITVDADNVYINANESITQKVESIDSDISGLGDEIEGLDTRLKQAELKITDDEIAAAVTRTEIYSNLEQSIENAQSTADSAKDDIATTNTELTKLTERVASAELKLKDDQIVMTVTNSKTYQDDISSVNQSTQAAQNAANAAQSTADNAQASANNALGLAGEAQQSADDAKTAADKAQEAADNAQSSANTAQSSADAAQSKANDAADAAQKAQETADAAQSSLNTAVSSVRVEYGTSDSRTEMTGNDWNTSAPDWQEGKYIWMRTVTELKDGTILYSDETCISGIDGKDGEDGLPGGKGADGQTSYFHVKYSTVANPTKEQMVETPSEYIGTYVDFIEEDSTDPDKYTWVKFMGTDGINGKDGIAGTNGEDGKTSYLHIKYSNDGGLNFTSNNGEDVGDWLGQYVDFDPNDSATPGDYKWSKIKGSQGLPGETGDDGKTYYTWLKYALDENGTGITDDPAGMSYIGLAYNKDSQDELNDPSLYTWSLIQGPAGNDGDDGKTYYTWIRYSTYADGREMTDSPTDNTLYIGLAYNQSSPDESDDATEYKWSLIKGSDGSDGIDGIGISSVVAEYAVNTSKTDPPEDDSLWSEESPTWTNGSYIWTRSKITYTDGNIEYTSPLCDSSWEAVNALDGNIVHQGTEPTNPFEGMLWLDTSNGKNELKRYVVVVDEETNEIDNEDWVTVSDTELTNEVAKQYNELSASIKSSKDEVDDKLEDYATKELVTRLQEETKASLNIMNNNIRADFEVVQKDLVATADGLKERVTTLEEYVVIESDPIRMTLGSSAMPTKTIITADGMKIADKSDRALADFTSEGASVPRITIVEQMSLGNLMWVVHSNSTSSIMAN